MRGDGGVGKELPIGATSSGGHDASIGAAQRLPCMHLSRILIENFRNFSKLDVALDGNVVVVGENKVGKSNLMHALRLLFDPSLPDSARELGLADFWDGLGGPEEYDKIVIGVEIEEPEGDLDILVLLTDFRLDDDPDTVRLIYECRARPGLGRAPTSDDDLEFICFGGESETKRFGRDLRHRLTMDLLPALRDAEGDLAAWRRSPLRPLIEEAFAGIDQADLNEIGEAIEDSGPYNLRTAAVRCLTLIGVVHHVVDRLQADIVARGQRRRGDAVPAVPGDGRSLDL